MKLPNMKQERVLGLHFETNKTKRYRICQVGKKGKMLYIAYIKIRQRRVKGSLPE